MRDWEAPAALLSGSGGLAATAAIVQEGANLLESGGILALEVDERRASLVAEMIMSAGCYIDVGAILDFTGLASGLSFGVARLNGDILAIGNGMPGGEVW